MNFPTFIIRPPKWIRNYFIVIASVSLVGVICVLIVYLCGNMTLYASLSFGVILTLVAIASVIALIGYFGNSFYYRGGTYYRKKPFKKLMQANAKETKLVCIDETGGGFSGIKITFYAIDSRILMQFKDDDRILLRNIFTDSLKRNRIEIEHLKYEE